MRSVSSVVLLLFALPASAQQIQLDVQGDTLIVVKTFPVTVSVPKGFVADLYFWSVPPGVTFQDEGASVKIFAAPKGTLAIGLKTIKVDWDQKKLTQQFGSVAIVIGDVPGPDPKPPIPAPPIPVPPGPQPPAALVQSLKSALALDGEFEGRAKAKLFAAVAREMAPVCMDSAGFVKTGNDILAVWKISVSKTLAPGDIFQVRLTAAKWLDTQMPNRTVALTNEARANMRDTFLLLALAIEEAAK